MTNARERSLLAWYVQQAPLIQVGEHRALVHSDAHADLAGCIQVLLMHPFHAHL